MANIAMRYGQAGTRGEEGTVVYGNMIVVYANGGGNTSSAYNSSVLDVGEAGNTCYYQFGGGGLQSKTFSFQGSNDNSNWTTINSTSNSASRITGITGNDNNYRYYRLHVNAGTASAQNGYRGMMACVDTQNPS